jgi:hypothetical protein
VVQYAAEERFQDAGERGNAMGVRSRRTVEPFLKVFLALVLALGLTPLPGHTARAYAQEGSDASATTLTSQVRNAIDQAESDGACVPGQALVVYHASGAAKGATGTLAIQSDSDPLSQAGFSAEETWDLSTADSMESANAASSDGALSVQSESTGSAIASGSDVRVALVSRDGVSVSDLVAQLESLSYVECAQPNYVSKQEDSSASAETSSNTQASSSSAATTPQNLVSQGTPLGGTVTNDTFNSLQWGLSGTSGEIAESTLGIGYASALAKDTSSSTKENSTVVAVLDTGVDYTNPDLAGQMWSDPGNIGLGTVGSHGYNGVTGSYDPMPTATSEHGTHCAGIVAAQSNNKEGIASAAGANQHTQIMGLRQEADNGRIIDAANIACYEYLVRARAAGVNVVAVNCSWGPIFGGAYLPVLDYAINQAGKAGILSVFGAGNTSSDVQNDYQIGELESPYLIDVASVNQENVLSAFSCYNETAIDIAAPGSRILSTIPNASGATYFMPQLSCLAGKTKASDGMLYYTDVATLGTGTSGVTYTLLDTSTQQTFTCPGAVTLETTGTELGSNALKVSINCDTLAAANHTPANVRVNLSWSMKNPFKEYKSILTDKNPSHYAVGATVDESGLSGMKGFYSYLGLYAGTTELTKSGVRSYVVEDTLQPKGSTLTALDTDSDTLTAQVGITCDDHTGGQSTVPSGTWSCLVTGYGIGKITDPTQDSATTAMKSAYVPYLFESGTSMAAPMITGSVAELAALYPTYAPLQLRGIICGSTKTIAAADQAKVASGGRFTFDAAFDNSTVNANTWSITTSGSSVTVHGCNLNRATLNVDNAKVTPTAQTADSFTFAADSSLFDGARHRFDVTDTSTNRTYKAAYVMPATAPSATPDSLVRLGNLPTDSSAGTAQLVSATDRLFYADGNGEYLYSCADPLDESAARTKLAAPGTPWAGPSSNNRSRLTYAYADGKLYAFSTDDVAATESTAEQAVVYCNVYDISANSWSGFQKIGSFDSAGVESLSATSCTGTVCCEAYYDTGSGETGVLLTKAPDATAYTQTSLTSSDSQLGRPRILNGIGGKLYGLATYTAADGALQTALVTCDSATGAISKVGIVSGYGTAADTNEADSRNISCQAGVGNGVVTAGLDAKSYGDLQLVDIDRSLVKLGSFGLYAADGLTAESQCMYAGDLFLNCVDHATENTESTGLYTLPVDAAAKVTTTDTTASAAADPEGGGTATVSDWRGSAASSLTVRSGDTATWTAIAADGYTFQGWYDADGNLVSDQATYSARVSADRGLVARFAATPGSTPTPAPGDGTGTGSYGTTPQTGDTAAPWALVLLAALVAAGGVAIESGRRMRRS